MTAEMQALLEATIRQGLKDNVSFIGVTIEANGMRFWRNVKDSQKDMARIFDILADTMRRGTMHETILEKES